MSIQKEVEFVEITGEKKELGEPYMDEGRFKEISEIINSLKEKRDAARRQERRLLRIIEDGKGSYVDISHKTLKDKTIICVDCNKTFIFYKGEQQYFLSAGLQEPKRCKHCRLLKKLSANTKGIPQ